MLFSLWKARPSPFFDGEVCQECVVRSYVPHASPSDVCKKASGPSLPKESAQQPGRLPIATETQNKSKVLPGSSTEVIISVDEVKKQACGSPVLQKHGEENLVPRQRCKYGTLAMTVSFGRSLRRVARNQRFCHSPSPIGGRGRADRTAFFM